MYIYSLARAQRRSDDVVVECLRPDRSLQLPRHNILCCLLQTESIKHTESSGAELTVNVPFAVH